MKPNHLGVSGVCSLGVNDVREVESGWTKTAVSRNGGLLQTQLIYLTQPHIALIKVRGAGTQPQRPYSDTSGGESGAATHPKSADVNPLYDS